MRQRYLGLSLLTIMAVVALTGCGYYYYAGGLEPHSNQSEFMSIADDGTVTFEQNRLEVSLKPMTDDELNRLYPDYSDDGAKSTNPFTFGNAEFQGEEEQRRRFTVFRLKVKNYAYPKVRIDPSNISMVSSNKREYWSLGFDQMDTYYRAYAIGYRGNEYHRYQERRDVMRRAMYAIEDVFSGQEKEGFVVFEVLHSDVEDIAVGITDIVTRFNYAGEPVEMMDLSYEFTREIGRVYSDGRRVATK